MQSWPKIVRRLVRYGAYSLLVLGMVILAAGAWLSTSLPNTDSEMTLAGLDGQVKIYRDKIGVPTIYATTDSDAYVALGYVHAQDRFWQMETMRRLGQGRLAEIFGERALRSDKWFRTMGLEQRAQDDFDSLSEPVQKAMKSYARGVNQWLSGKSGLLAPEFAIFRYKPDQWKPMDSMLWGKIMSMRLSGNWRDEVLRTLLSRKLSPAQVRALWPGPEKDRIFSSVVSPARNPLNNLQTSQLKQLAGVAPWPVGLPKGASNIWVVNGDKTTSKKPLLANDPHLGFTAPIVWYMARIVSPNLNVTGATVPGVPFHVLGHNLSMAWGVTSTQSDLQDLVIEKIQPDNPDQYVTLSGPKTFQKRRQNIVVKGADNVRLNVQTSQNGPIISNLLPKLSILTGTDFEVALKATFLEPGDRSIETFYDLNRATSMTSFNSALKKFQGPQLNFVFADVSGNIGFMAPGLVPVRSKGKGLVPVSGWNNKKVWQKFIAFDELPKQFNPERGQFVNANNSITENKYPYFISQDWAPGYRAQQIENQLVELTPHSLRSFSKIQLNTASLMAGELVPILTEFKNTGAKQQDVIALLSNWGGDMDRDRPEPLLFYAWLRALNLAIYGDDLGDLTPRYMTLRPKFIVKVLTGKLQWCDDVNTLGKTETCEQIVAQSLDTALSNIMKRRGLTRLDELNLSELKWGDEHIAWFDNPVLGSIPLIGELATLRIESSGGNYTINRGATHMNDKANPFRHVHGAGFRAIYDLSDLRKSRFMIATGQSGNILSTWYGDLLTFWRDGVYRRLNLSERSLQQLSDDVLVLMPAENP